MSRRVTYLKNQKSEYSDLRGASLLKRGWLRSGIKNVEVLRTSGGSRIFKWWGVTWKLWWTWPIFSKGIHENGEICPEMRGRIPGSPPRLDPPLRTVSWLSLILLFDFNVCAKCCKMFITLNVILQVANLFCGAPFCTLFCSTYQEGRNNKHKFIK